MTLSKEEIDYLAAHDFTFEEIQDINEGLEDIKNGRVISFEDVVKKIKKGKPVSYV